MKGIGLMIVVAAVFAVHEISYKEGIKAGIAKHQPYEQKHSCQAAKALVSAFRKTCAVNLIAGESN